MIPSVFVLPLFCSCPSPSLPPVYDSPEQDLDAFIFKSYSHSPVTQQGSLWACRINRLYAPTGALNLYIPISSEPTRHFTLGRKKARELPAFTDRGRSSSQRNVLRGGAHCGLESGSVCSPAPSLLRSRERGVASHGWTDRPVLT